MNLRCPDLSRNPCDNDTEKGQCRRGGIMVPWGDWTPSAVAVDIDGTLTDGNRILDGDALRALKRLEEAGIPVILATGNVRPVAYGLWRFSGLSGPMVCENGGVVWHPDWDAPLLMGDARRAQAASDWLATRIEGLDPKGITTNAWRESEWCLAPDGDLARIREELATSPYSDLVTVRTGFAIHVMEPGLSKAIGLKHALSHLEVPPDAVLAIGDAPNDLSMFGLVGRSIAVGGAFPEVVAAADLASPHPHSKAVIVAVEDILDSN